ncbi:PREDICTED: PRAME family member 23-like [Chinchilla lanigera]|uniref:PRAME family member 23-like n=1 Tax=Chinchilla lanigera TaxID=34839 RepID=UPI0006969D23|nr:PREDICTED: PRAME family member 23-like [Chinchilla lanigera]
MQSPPPLYELAKQSLLKSDTTASTALHELPTMIFYDLFMDAFMGEHNEVLKVMVQAWPFPYLPLKTLMDLRKPKMPHSQFGEITLQQRNLQTLEAVLDGLDIQLSQKVHHSRWKLQVLDWRDVHQDFWTAGPRAMSAAHSVNAWNKDMSNPGLSEENPTLRIFANLRFEAWDLFCATNDQLQLCLLKWARGRKASVHLFCEKVMINSSAVFEILKLLQAVRLYSIHELEVLSYWCPERMKAFVPQLKKMKNLHKFHFSRLRPELFTSTRKKKSYSHMCAFHLGQLKNLRDLQLDEVFFLQGNLHKIVRSQTPLEVLSLSSSPLKESDLHHLSQRASTSQLKSLSLRWISMKLFNPEILQALIDKLASTLETLVLDHCDITDSHLLAILPALSCCSQLKTFSCYGNHFSLSILQVLLNLSAGLSQLTQGLYPAPLESYESNIPTMFVHPELFDLVCAELEEILKAIRPSLQVQICTHSWEGRDTVPKCDSFSCGHHLIRILQKSRVLTASRDADGSNKPGSITNALKSPILGSSLPPAGSGAAASRWVDLAGHQVALLHEAQAQSVLQGEDVLHGVRVATLGVAVELRGVLEDYACCVSATMPLPGSMCIRHGPVEVGAESCSGGCTLSTASHSPGSSGGHAGCAAMTGAARERK